MGEWSAEEALAEVQRLQEQLESLRAALTQAEADERLTRETWMQQTGAAEHAALWEAVDSYKALSAAPGVGNAMSPLDGQSGEGERMASSPPAPPSDTQSEQGKP